MSTKKRPVKTSSALARERAENALTQSLTPEAPEEWAGGDSDALDDIRRERFCHYIVEGLRQYVAARRSGLAAPGSSIEAAYQRGAVLVREPAIKARIRAITKETHQRLQITTEKTLAHLAAIAYSDVGDLLEMDNPEGRAVLRAVQDIPAHARLAIRKMKIRGVRRKGADGPLDEVVTEVDLCDKRAALELLMKHQKLIAADEAPTDAGVYYVFEIPQRSTDPAEWAKRCAPLKRLAEG